MTTNIFSSRKACFVLMGAMALIWPGHGVFAETLVNERLLGMTEQSLKTALPAMIKTSKPVPGPHGERGLWLLKSDSLTGDGSETVFFFKFKLVHRIQQRWKSPAASCSKSHESLVHELTIRYGPGLLSDDGKGSLGQSAAWMADTFKVMLHETIDPTHCTLLVAFEPLQQIDSSQL